MALKFVIFFLTIVVFFPGLGGGFIFDDAPNIVDNTALHLNSLNVQELLYAAYSFQPGHGTRPLPMLSFALDYWRGGMDAATFKMTNLVIHGLTALALLAFFRKLLNLSHCSSRQAQVGAVLLALAWALHPLQVSSVLYVVQRMQTMGTLFVVLALIVYLNARQAQILGQRSRLYIVLTLLFAVLALACKEDSALLPAYMLCLELTVLRFQAKEAALANWLKKSFTVFVGVGLMVFLFVIVPHYWHWDAYPGRLFSTPERLLTQGRVLLLYIVQIVFPLPDLMPFYYDGLEISHGFFQPWTTAVAWLVLAMLLVTAWMLRATRPLFALGIFLFFTGHFISSNVVSLELAFEHRNHFAMIGILLAVFDVAMYIWRRFALKPKWAIVASVAYLLTIATATVARAHVWGEPLRFAQKTVEIAPNSARAWLVLCTNYFDRSNSDKESPYLDLAISTCEKGADQTQAPPLFSNVVIFKTVKGTVTQDDWNQFLKRLQAAPLSAQNLKVVWTMLNNVDRQIPLNEDGVLKTIEIIASRTQLYPHQYIRMGAYIYNETQEPGKAYPFFQHAVELAAPGDADVQKMLMELKEAGREDWVEKLNKVQAK
ncbi:hypothetical protein ACFIQF_15960 [Comamonas sp. J-3]|uniref:hypothetical protein n=1 Tax=Comamonas trifloxystrobinivorans TaxID=3350256 RepID=UPI00372C90A7